MVRITGMFGNDKTYFAGSPVVINVEGLEWPTEHQSPFTVVRVQVIYESTEIGEFVADVGNKKEISFDISSALRAIWSDYEYAEELAAATTAMNATANSGYTRQVREYSLQVFTEYVADDGEFTKTDSGTFAGGKCIIGGMTEMERSLVPDVTYADVSSLEHSNQRNGDASTKPVSVPERVGVDSITCWADVAQGVTESRFYMSDETPDDDDTEAHAPQVIRDDVPYVDFLFVNRRGAVETCSAQMKEALSIGVETTLYSRTERPSFIPSRSIMAMASGGRRSWSMSSGHQTREWAEWWSLEFLMARRWWMWYNGRFVPVTVEPAKKNIGIYDRSKQQMPSVEFVVTLAMEG